MLLCMGIALAALAVPPLHLALLCANGLVAFWLGQRDWDWLRKYTSFYFIESLYFCALFSLPESSYGPRPWVRELLPAGPYFYFLWSAIDMVAVLKLGDFVMCRTDPRDRTEFSLARLGFLLFYPFALFGGPVLGIEEISKGMRSGLPSWDDVLYSGRKFAWGFCQLLVLAPWLQASTLELRRSVLAGTGLAAVMDSRLVMWLWIAGMSVLLYFIYKGYTDIMLAASRLAGLHVQEQFWFTLFAKDPAEYWQNGNRGVYRVTSQYIFVRLFERHRLAPKAVLSTVASGVAHALMCPGITLAGGLVLGSLFGLSGLAVALLLHIRRTRIASWFEPAREGTAHNALVISGVIVTFALMCFPRSGFLLFVEGLSVAEWFQLLKLLFVRV